LPYVRSDSDLSVNSAPHYADIHQVVAWLPPCILSVGVNCARAEPDILRISLYSLSVLVTKHVNRGFAADRIVRVILVHQPVRRVVTDDEIYHIVDWIQHGLKRTQVQAIARIVGAARTGQ
jgi:hypothetical protein